MSEKVKYFISLVLVLGVALTGTVNAQDDGLVGWWKFDDEGTGTCLLYTSPSPRDRTRSRMPSSA